MYLPMPPSWLEVGFFKQRGEFEIMGVKEIIRSILGQIINILGIVKPYSLFPTYLTLLL